VRAVPQAAPQGAALPTAAVHVTVAVGAEAELAADALRQAGATAIEERPAPGSGVVLVAGVATASDVEPLMRAAARWPAELVAVDLDAALAAWRAHARVVPVGERLVVRPPWLAPAAGGPGPGRLELVIDPGRAFGSGAHASTRLALAALDELIAGGERVLDAGCGSGVLAIAALRLGAAEAVGLDLDPVARAVTRANAERNGVGERLTTTGDLAAPVATAVPRFDLVVANLLLPAHRELAPTLGAGLAGRGALVVSGVLVDQGPAVLDAYAAAGLRGLARRVDDGWLGLILRVR
jgi:ribosomal protein L11 methyltransferase